MFGLFQKQAKTYKDLSTRDFQAALQNNKDAVLIDVRSKPEVNQGKIKGAININVLDPSERQKLAKLPKDKPLLLYCRSGNRSGMACRLLTDMGYDDVTNLKGGIASWKGKLQ